MDINELNKALITLIEKKQALSKLSYNDDRYDDMEEELHDLEDVHAKLCPDSDVLLPTAYLPNNLGGETTAEKEGVWVDSDEFPGKEARLILVPNPARLILSVGKTVRKEVWTAGE